MHNWFERPLIQKLRSEPKTWLVTGAAGFIGSNLVEWLLRLNQRVCGLDSLITGHGKNLDRVRDLVEPTQWSNFSRLDGDIGSLDTCRQACLGVDYVLHQAALGSVPRSIVNPVASHEANISGFLNLLVAAREAAVVNFVYASSSSIYGDHPGLPKIEGKIGRPLSPYAVTKYVNELYAEVFARVYGFQCIGLIYFNVFGPRQDPEGAYAAVIPKWFASILRNEPVYINGDGETSRDFCYVENVVQANLLAALASDSAARNQVYNIAYGESTTLNQLYALIQENLQALGRSVGQATPVYRDFRAGDVRHSLADISKARGLLGYEPQFSIREGLRKAASWYVKNCHTMA